MSDPIRKLAEVIAEPFLYDDAHEKIIDQWEVRLRSALPELSQVLGELAAVKAVAERWKAIIVDAGGGRVDVLRRCVHDLNAALSSDSGRLSGEALVALLKWYETSGHDCRSDEENVLQQMAARLRVEFPGLRAGRAGEGE